MSGNRLREVKTTSDREFIKSVADVLYKNKCYNADLSKVCVINIPNKMNRGSISKFLYDVEFIFSDFKTKHPLVLYFMNCRDVSISGLLVVYIVLKLSRKSSVSKIFTYNEFIRDVIEKKGFLNLYSQNLTNGPIDSPADRFAQQLFEIREDNFFMFPQRLFDFSEKKKQSLVDAFIAKINEFYARFNCSNAVSPIATCITEILSNFWSHSCNKYDTYIVAEGNKDYFRVCTLDTGRGIISTLKDRYPGKSDRELISSCVEKGISSKKNIDEDSFHLGCGLYYVYEIAKSNDGILDIWSEGYHLSAISSRKKISECGYWKGAILELSFNVSKAKGIGQICKGD